MNENKVTLEGIKAKIKANCYLVLPDGRTTICMLSMENGVQQTLTRSNLKKLQKEHTQRPTQKSAPPTLQSVVLQNFKERPNGFLLMISG